jgi:C2 domain
MQNTFAVASCHDDAGTLPYATRPISRSLTPHWDELAVFKDVAPTDRLHISVLDRRLMGPHLLLGQVCSRDTFDSTVCCGIFNLPFVFDCAAG